MTNPTQDAPMVHVGTISHGLAVLSQAQQFAELLAQAQFIPTAYRGKPGDIMACVLYGEQLGVAPLQALQGVAVINGRPSVWGDLALAVARAHPEFRDIVEELGGKGDDYGATCTITRRNQTPVVRRFTWKDAERAGLKGKQGPWTQYPQRMLQMRARAWALRDSFADALCGLAVREELEDHPETEVLPPPRIEPPKEVPRGRQKATLPTEPELPPYWEKQKAIEEADRLRREAAEAEPELPAYVRNQPEPLPGDYIAPPPEPDDVLAGIGEEPEPNGLDSEPIDEPIDMPKRRGPEKNSTYIHRIAGEWGLSGAQLNEVLGDRGVSLADLDKEGCPVSCEDIVPLLRGLQE